MGWLEIEVRGQTESDTLHSGCFYLEEQASALNTNNISVQISFAAASLPGRVFSDQIRAREYAVAEGRYLSLPNFIPLP